MIKLTQEPVVVGMYDSQAAAEAGIKALQEAGLDTRRLSTVVLVMAQGTADMIVHARAILATAGLAEPTARAA